MLLTQTITALGNEPVTVAEVKVSARIDDDITELDGQIQTLISSTRLAAEHECERQFLPHTLQLEFSGWPSGALPVAPVTELVGVEALDGTGWVPVNGFALLQTICGTASVVYTGNPSELPALPVVEGERVRVKVKVGCSENIRAYIIAMVVHQITTASAAQPTNPPSYLAGLLDRERSWV